MKKEAAENGYPLYLEKFLKNREEKKNGIKAAVIGAGSSGLSAAYFLARAGFDVTVFDKEKQGGGVVQNIIPDFRLPQTAIDKDIHFIKEHGVKFKFNVDESFSVVNLKSEGFKYIYIAIGAENSKQLSLSGDNKNIVEGIRFLRAFRANEPISPGKHVAVIGGGNSAMDGARAARRCRGVEKVYIIYRRTKEFMPADMEEFDAAMEDGVIFRDLLLPIDFSGQTLTCQKMELGPEDKDGRRSVVPLENQLEEIHIDWVISAIGETIKPDFIRSNKLLNETEDHILIKDASTETGIENVFAGGDALRGPSSVVEAIADGRATAETILQKENIAPSILDFSKKLFNPSDREQKIVLNKGLVLSSPQIPSESEASRCLGCSFLCAKCVDVCPNRANVAIRVNGKPFKDRYQILHLDGMCNECGNCETFCPHSGAPYRDKLTLFWNESVFMESQNDGFVLLNYYSPAQINFNLKIRYNQKIALVTYHVPEKKMFSSLENEGAEYEAFKKYLAAIFDHYLYLFNIPA